VGGIHAEHGGVVRVHRCPESVSGVVSRDARAAEGREPEGNTSPLGAARTRGVLWGQTRPLAGEAPGAGNVDTDV
jgi:hypothetical protein